MGSHANRAEKPHVAEVREVMDGIRRVVRMLRVSASASERRVGISGAQLFVLQQLVEAGPCSINDLAERTLTHQSSVSVVVTKLIDRGLVTRSRSAEDGRRVEVALSPAGRALLREAPPMSQARLIQGLRSMKRNDVERLAHGLRALVVELGLEESESPLFFEEEPAAGRAKPRRSRGAVRTRG